MECKTSRVNPNVIYGYWVIMMCQCSFISYNKCTYLMGNVDNGGSYACAGVEGMWEISVLSPKFALSLKLLLKKEQKI